MLLAISYQVLPELQEHYARIMWAFQVRAVGAAIGALAAFFLVRFEVYGTPGVLIRSSWPVRRIGTFALTVLFGIVPGAIMWCAVEAIGGGYWLWEAVDAGAPRESLLGIIGWTSWSIALGHLVTRFAFRPQRQAGCNP